MGIHFLTTLDDRDVHLPLLADDVADFLPVSSAVSRPCAASGLGNSARPLRANSVPERHQAAQAPLRLVIGNDRSVPDTSSLMFVVALISNQRVRGGALPTKFEFANATVPVLALSMQYVIANGGSSIPCHVVAALILADGHSALWARLGLAA